MTYSRNFPITFDPAADLDAVVAGPNVRFTVLTSRLIRMEYSTGGTFEDRPSQVFWYRRQPAPGFHTSRAGGEIQIETEHLDLRYGAGADGFTGDYLSITLKATGASWCYGQEDPGNLRGTCPYPGPRRRCDRSRAWPGVARRMGGDR